jgi:predicted transcriptional regulator
VDESNNNDQSSAQIAAIAAAYFGNPSNPVEKSQIGEIIREIRVAMSGPAAPVAAPEPEAPKPTPASIRKSITHDHLISFIDNKPYKSLKRHLATNGHTPQSYRERFGLYPDYPMVAPSYSEQRSALAKKAGFGQRALTPAAASPAPTATPAPVAAPAAAAPKAKAAKPAPAAKAAPAPKAKPVKAAEAKPAETKPAEAKAPAKAPVAKAAPAPKTTAPKTAAPKAAAPKAKAAKPAPAAKAAAPAKPAETKPVEAKAPAVKPVQAKATAKRTTKAPAKPASKSKA